MLNRLLFLVSLSLLLVMPGSSWAQQTFGVTVPGRNAPTTADGLPVARIKITLHFGSNPSGATLGRVGGPSGIGFSASAQSFGSGDMVRFQPGAGNTIDIELLPFSNLASPGNYCARSSGGTSQFDLELASAPAVTGYQLTSYRAPITDYACSCDTRRIIDEPSQWTSPPSGSSLGRHPLTMIMVLDESGSMGLPLSPDTRMERLNQQAGNVVDLWDITTGPGDDQLGVIFFTTGVSPLTFPPSGGSFFVRRDATTPGGTWADVEPVIRGRTPKNRTAMGDGLKEAFDQSGTLDDVAIVLFTDGIENEGTYRTQPCLELPGGTCPASVPSDLMNLYDDDAPDRISIPGRCALTQTIGIGASGSIQTNVLDRIATQTGGVNESGFASEVMNAGSFQQALLNILDAGTLHEIFRATSSLSAGQQTGTSRTVYVNRSARQLIGSLSWYGVDNPDALALRVVGPNGTVRQADRVTRRQDYLLAAFDVEDEVDVGEWQLSVVRGQYDDDLDYEVAALLDDTVLNYSLAGHRPHYFTGDPVHLLLTVTENGRPAQGLTADGIEATLLRPSGALGNILFEREVPAQVLRQGVSQLRIDQPITPYARKLQYVLADEEVVDLLTPAPTEQALTIRKGPVTLDDGTTVGGASTFVITLPETNLPGTYKVQVRFRADLEESGRVERTDQLQVPIQVRPNLAESQVEAEAQDGSVLVQFAPRDVYGNYLGPGYGQKLDVTTADRTTPFPVEVQDTNTQGVYELAIQELPVDDNPRLIFRVDGRPYHAVTVEQLVSGTIPEEPGLGEADGPVCNLTGGSPGVLVFGVVLLGVVVAFRRRRGRHA